MKTYKYRYWIYLPSGKVITRICKIYADNQEECDRLFDLWYSVADRKELIEITE